MLIKDHSEWEKFKADPGNQGYMPGKLIKAAEKWASAMEISLNKGEELTKLLTDSSFSKVDDEFGNFSGFQFSVIRDILVDHWFYGVQLDKIYFP